MLSDRQQFVHMTAIFQLIMGVNPDPANTPVMVNQSLSFWGQPREIPGRLNEKHRAIAAGLDTDRKLTLFHRDVVSTMQDVSSIESAPVFAALLNSYISDGIIAPPDVLHLATHALELSATGTILLRRFGEDIVPVVVQDKSFEPVRRAVETWRPDVTRADSLSMFWKRPDHIHKQNVLVDAVTYDLPQHVDAVREAIKNAPFAFRLHPSGDIILFSGHPYTGGVALATIPQDFNGDCYSIANDFVNHYDYVSQVDVNRVTVSVLLLRPLFMPAGKYEIEGIDRLPSGVNIEFTITEPGLDDNGMTSEDAAHTLAQRLLRAGKWSGQKSIKVVDPRTCLKNVAALEFYSPVEFGGINIYMKNPKYEMVITPVGVMGDADMPVLERVAAKIRNNPTVDFWGETSLFIQRADVIDALSDNGVISGGDLKLVFDPHNNVTSVFLNLINADNENQRNRVRAVFDIAGAAILAGKCEFDVTRISAVASGQLKKWFDEIYAVCLKSTPTRTLAELIELTDILFGESKSAVNTTNQLKDKAYYVDSNTQTPNDPTAAAIWQIVTDAIDLAAAQKTRDYLLETIAVAAYDLAANKNFNAANIAGVSNTVIQRIVRVAAGVSQPHLHHWHSLNADMKQIYAESVRSKAAHLNRRATRPDYLKQS